MTGSFLAFLFPTSGYVSEDLGRRGLVLTPVQVRVPAGTTWQSHPTCSTPGSKNGVGKGFLALHSLVLFPFIVTLIALIENRAFGGGEERDVGERRLERAQER